MSEIENVDAQEIIDKIYDIQDEVIGGFLIGYCRSTDYKGDEDYHNFLAYTDDIVGSEFILGFSKLIEYYDPQKVELSTSKDHPHLKIGFKDERIVNAPPSANGEYDTLDVHGAKDGECVRCRRKTPRAYPSLTIKRDDTDSKWDTDFESREIDLCVDCSPAHYDDMSRVIDAICVEDGEVVAVECGDNDIISASDDKFSRVVTDGLVKVLERDIL